MWTSVSFDHKMSFRVRLFTLILWVHFITLLLLLEAESVEVSVLVLEECGYFNHLLMAVLSLKQTEKHQSVKLKSAERCSNVINLWVDYLSPELSPAPLNTTWFVLAGKLLKRTRTINDSSTRTALLMNITLCSSPKNANDWSSTQHMWPCM